MLDGTFCRGAAEVCLAERLLLTSLVPTALETGRTELGRGRWAVTWSGVTVHLPFLTALGEVRKPVPPGSRRLGVGTRDGALAAGSFAA